MIDKRTARLVLLAVLATAWLAWPAATEPWVVLSVHYSGPKGQAHPGGTGKHSVVCVLAGDLGRHYSDRGEHIEIAIPAERSSYYMQGMPCPQGPVITRF